MEESTTFNIFYDGISFQHLATVLIYVFTLFYGPGLLFRGPTLYNLFNCTFTTKLTNMAQYGELNSVKKTTINIWLNDGVY